MRKFGLVAIVAGLSLAVLALGTVTEVKADKDVVAKPVNVKCPIMGGAIDPNNVNPKLTRQFKGQTVAFCCGMCPAKWDKLSDAEKETKLDAVKASAAQSAEGSKGGCCG